jgi:hypothetical protein
VTPKQFQELIEAAKRRDTLRYVHLRQVLVMATGALSVLVALNTGAGSSGTPLFFLHLAWITGGLGILSGTIALSGEPHMATKTVRQLSAMHTAALKQAAASGTYPRSGPFAIMPAWWIRPSEVACNTSLTIALLSLVAFALTR